jgi:hypothetical protein
MQKIIAMFDTGEADVALLGTVIETVTDAWNYFPHKTLNNLCPQELLELNERGEFYPR